MSDTKALTNLNQGAAACFDNAKRLVDDAELLFQNKRCLSCSLLSELAEEEMAKAFKLLEKERKKAVFSRKEWEGFTRGAKAHRKKLLYIRDVYNRWLKKTLKSGGASYKEFLEDYFDEYSFSLADLTKMLKEMDEMQAGTNYDFRLQALYVQYDFEEKKWTNPSRWVFANDPQYSSRLLGWAKDLLSILDADLRRKG